ncbi:type II toxin-antitoxin system HipA family toxin (plasmid) [Stutzerimonas frequens]|uniref:type II toxin-antitoxin system HipA family toxin n=1 Tax=Stutzerimonas frequens TaxID=2968969 RepID=UPI002DB72F88|nr:type II toxin-antitoxin system HipA family toxin [Stutzerimonas frequens]WRW29406.1 type II toxin-antitoxin system HipA family toxin [Stutzerimonas frequens]
MNWTPISKAYVFAVLNGEPRPMGLLAKDIAGFRFAYAQSWLSAPDAFSADPLNLPLSSGEKAARKLWGCFEDATPDNWGRKVMLATHKQAPANEIEWLLASRGAGAGCLLFSASRHSVTAPVPVPEFSELEQLLELADEIDRGELPDHLDDALAKLLVYGSSMGGARPKVTVRLDGRQYIAKLSRRDDLFNQPRAEFASLTMAGDAGIPVPGHQLHTVNGRTVLLVERFDREAEHRRHYLSANALIAPDRMREGDIEGSVSYLRIAAIIQKISQDAQADLHDLYRRMVFNVAISNTDDHLKNHGFLHQGDDQYRLAPAFDILPHPDQTSDLALIAGTHGRAATFENALTMCERFGLSKAQAGQVIDEVAHVTARAASYFQQAEMARLEVGILTAACSRPQQRVMQAEGASASTSNLSGPRL